MRFVASLTRNASELNKILELWRESDDPRNPFENVLITPLFMPPSGLKVIRQWKEEGIIRNLYFDSGGFYVQMGKIDYVDLYYPLLQYYKKERWADWYVLPDHVPLSNDAPDVIDRKVRDTVESGRNFFEELSSDLQQKAIPVVHGYTAKQIDYALTNHLKMQTGYIGFGSFDTSGSKSSVNKVGKSAYENLKHITSVAEEVGAKTHVFGVGNPPVIHLLSLVNVFSFDSIGWMKTAGFGNVFLPFIRAYNVSYLDESATTITKKQFEQMKEITGHHCSFCDSFQRISKERYIRTMHNVSVILDMMDERYPNRLDMLPHDIMRLFSPNYYKLWKRI